MAEAFNELCEGLARGLQDAVAMDCAMHKLEECVTPPVEAEIKQKELHLHLLKQRALWLWVRRPPLWRLHRSILQWRARRLERLIREMTERWAQAVVAPEDIDAG